MSKEDWGIQEERGYWLNTRTGEVEVGPLSNALDRVGPFATPEEAARGMEIIAERAKQWALDEELED